jgi:hypothetical protein
MCDSLCDVCEASKSCLSVFGAMPLFCVFSRSIR